MNRSLPLPVLAVCAAAFFPAVAAAAPDTAKDAMRIVARDRGAEYLNRMIHVLGDRGTDQPQVWRVISRDANGAVREFFVSNGKVISDGIVPPSDANGISGTPLPMHRLNIDSTEAFRKAEATARAAKLGFDSVSYQLRCLELSTNAAWFLTLVNAQGLGVGEVSVGASTGTVIAAKWYSEPRRLTGQNGTPDADEGSNRSAVGQFWKNTRNGVATGIKKTHGWIRDKVSPKPAPAPYYVPPAR